MGYLVATAEASVGVGASWGVGGGEWVGGGSKVCMAYLQLNSCLLTFWLPHNRRSINVLNG